MSGKLLKSFAKRTGVDIKNVRREWKAAKKELSLVGINETSPEFYTLILSSFKKRLGLKENYVFLEKFKTILRET